MKGSRVALRYARAFVDTLAEKNAWKDADSFLDFCRLASANKELSALFANITVSNGDKANVVRALAKKAALPGTVALFLEILAANGRLSLLADVAAAVVSMRDERQNIKAVVLTAATEPSRESLAAFTAKMEKVLGCGVRLDLVIDPEILGGAVAQVDSVVYDGSVSGRLARLRRELVKEN